MLRVALLRDFDEERLFGVRLYADRLRSSLAGRCDVVDVHPRPRRAIGSAIGRTLQTLAVKEVLYPVEARGLVGDIAHVVDQSHAHLARWIRGPATVVTCHDLWGLSYGGALRRAAYRRRVLGLCVASRVVAVSESTRRGAIALGVDPERIAVVRNRVDRFFLDAPRAAELASAQERLGSLDGPFVLHVGNTLPYKNVEGLLVALGSIRQTARRKLPLVKAGAPLTTGQRQLADREDVRVVFVGEVSRAELRALYHLAACLVYPSFEEGFGWPVAEAIVCGRPVVAARSGALPEIAAEAALFVDAGDVGDLAAAILRVLEDESMRQDLCSRARERARWLTEGDFGAEMVEVYRQAIAERPNR